MPVHQGSISSSCLFVMLCAMGTVSHLNCQQVSSLSTLTLLLWAMLAAEQPVLTKENMVLLQTRISFLLYINLKKLYTPSPRCDPDFGCGVE